MLTGGRGGWSTGARRPGGVTTGGGVILTGGGIGLMGGGIGLMGGGTGFEDCVTERGSSAKFGKLL